MINLDEHHKSMNDCSLCYVHYVYVLIKKVARYPTVHITTTATTQFQRH